MGRKILIEIFFSHSRKIIELCRLDIRKYSFSQRTINEWNKLSTDCSMNMFKNKVDTFFRRVDYTQIKNVGLSISQWLPCLLAIWAFALDGNLVKSC